MEWCSDNAVDLDHRPAAQLLYDKLHPFADIVAFTMGTVEGPISRPVGRLAHLLGRHDEAETLFEAALAMSERLEAPYWIARTKLDYADLLTNRAQPHDNAKATELAEQALEASRAVRVRRTTTTSDRRICAERTRTEPRPMLFSGCRRPTRALHAPLLRFSAPRSKLM